MKVGDKVSWVSQASGFTKRKEGEIVAVVPPGEYGYNHAKRVNEERGYIYSGFDNLQGGSTRKRESYVVMVPNRVKGGKLYWPREYSLVLVGSAAPEQAVVPATTSQQRT